MTKLTDGIKKIEMYMGTWDGENWSPDCTAEIFDSVSHGFDEDGCIIVDVPIDDIIEFAKTWERGDDEWTKEALQDAAFEQSFDGDDPVQNVRNEISRRHVDIYD